MDKNRLTKIVLNYKPGGKRNKLQEDPARIIKTNSTGDGKDPILNTEEVEIDTEASFPSAEAAGACS